jgi:vancomycin resistance protein YoaR
MTDSPTTAPSSRPRRRRLGLRFTIAFVAGLFAAMALGVGALYGYDQQYAGRILPGVRVGAVDLSGLTPDAARQRLETSYARLSGGSLVLRAGEREETVPWSALDRRLETEALVADAMSVGRSENPVERVIGNAKTALRGVSIEPRLTYDPQALAARIEAFAQTLDAAPTDASVAVDAEGITLVEGVDGAIADRRAPLEAALAALAGTDAPVEIVVEVPVAPVAPAVTTAEATAARQAAEQIAQDLIIAIDDDESFPIRASTIRTWLRIAPTVDGALTPVLDVTKVAPVLDPMAAAVRQVARNASFTLDGETIGGITPAVDGRTMVVSTTAKAVTEALLARASTPGSEAVQAAVRTVEPSLTTAEAEAAAPKMKRISRWTTAFPIGPKNGNGANIWIPADDIDGYVVAPGEWFDFWEAVGPVTRERGYKTGAAIINGRTEPQGALAGGICSCSTTLFNAALRAGYEMGDRRNHYYYINRYPVGLDATVFKSSSGSVQSMSWRNDTEFPVLIRGYRIRDGGTGYVRFDLWSVPNGREVSISNPTIRNVRQSTDSTEYTNQLPAGHRERIEVPVDGMDVWVSRTVRDANGAVLHQDMFVSHYATITGIVRIGTG